MHYCEWKTHMRKDSLLDNFFCVSDMSACGRLLLFLPVIMFFIKNVTKKVQQLGCIFRWNRWDTLLIFCVGYLHRNTYIFCSACFSSSRTVFFCSRSLFLFRSDLPPSSCLWRFGWESCCWHANPEWWSGVCCRRSYWTEASWSCCTFSASRW